MFIVVLFHSKSNKFQLFFKHRIERIYLVYFDSCPRNRDLGSLAQVCFVSVVREERYDFRSFGFYYIICQLCYQQQYNLVVLLEVNEGPKVLFYDLVKSFYLSICLQIVSYRELTLYAQAYHQRLLELKRELSVSVRDPFRRLSVHRCHVPIDHVYELFCRPCFSIWEEVRPLSESVYYSENAIVLQSYSCILRRQQLSNEVYRHRALQSFRNQQ